MVAGDGPGQHLRQDRPRQPSRGAGRGGRRRRCSCSATGAPYGGRSSRRPSRAAVRRRHDRAAARVFRGLLGEPINIETLGGFLSWRVGNFLPVLLGLWPVIALSGHARGRGGQGQPGPASSTPHSRRTIALAEGRRARHGARRGDADPGRRSIWVVGQAFGVLPGDEIPFVGRPRPGRRCTALLMLAAGARRVRDRAVGRPDAGDGLRPHRALRRVPHLRLRDARRRPSTRSAAVVLVAWTAGPSADGRASPTGRRSRCSPS